MISLRLCAAGVILLLATCLQASAGPAVTVAVTPTALAQGSTLAVTVTADVPEGTLQVRFAGRVWPLYRDGDRWRTYLGTDPNTAAGTRMVAIELVNHEGTRVVAQRSITVRRVAFLRRRLTFDPDTLALLTPEKVAEEQAKVAAGLRVLAQTQQWAGAFQMPVTGTITSPYGVISIYQGTAHGWHHGVDIAAPEGEAVHAANSGIVRLAELLPLSGNTVIVDHGMGLITFYMHMSATEVIVNQYVASGTVVGLVGSTGLATGPHLHWGLRVNGVYVNPLLWLAK